MTKVGPVAPIFVLSLPRSGSTLLQRLLATAPEVSTASEPWILLPLLYALRPSGAAAEYDHRVMAEGVHDLLQQVPNGRELYLAEVKRLALDVYTAASAPGARFFVDKTPRYHLIAADLLEMFQDAPFVVLWRNPLAIVASPVENWAGGRWAVHRWHVDLYRGVANLVRAVEEHPSRITVVRYEDLVADPDFQLARLRAAMGLPDGAGPVDLSAAPPLGGSLGDRSGSGSDVVSKDPVEKWRRTLSNPVRKAWCRRYLRWIGRERLAVMGYDRDELLRDLHGVPSTPRMAVSDMYWLTRGSAVSRLRTVAHRDVEGSCLLQGAKDRVHGRETARDPLRRNGLPGNDAVPVEERQGQRVGSLGHRGCGSRVGLLGACIIDK